MLANGNATARSRKDSPYDGGHKHFEYAFFAFFAPLRYNELPIKYEEDVCGIILTRLKNIS